MKYPKWDLPKGIKENANALEVAVTAADEVSDQVEIVGVRGMEAYDAMHDRLLLRADVFAIVHGEMHRISSVGTAEEFEQKAARDARAAHMAYLIKLKM